MAYSRSPLATVSTRGRSRLWIARSRTRAAGAVISVAAAAPTIRADFHTHTCFSHDGYQTPRELVERARELRLDRVAITDHHTLDGALRARDVDPERVIVGEEI